MITNNNIINKIFADKDINKDEKYTFLIFISIIKDSKEALGISINTLMEAFESKGKKKLLNIISSLENKGYIEIIKTAGKTNKYRIIKSYSEKNVNNNCCESLSTSTDIDTSAYFDRGTSVDLDTTSSTDLDTGVNLDIGTSIDLDTSSSIDLDTSVNLDIGTSVDLDTTGSIDLDTSSYLDMGSSIDLDTSNDLGTSINHYGNQNRNQVKNVENTRFSSG